LPLIFVFEAAEPKSIPPPPKKRNVNTLVKLAALKMETFQGGRLFILKTPEKFSKLAQQLV
jgi:hypothetical protein